MDLKGFFRKVREVEEKIHEVDVYVTSLATPDGGQEGVITQVARRVAAQLIVDGKARIPTTEELAAFLADEAEKRLFRNRQEAASRIQVQLVSDPAGLLTPGPAKE